MARLVVTEVLSPVDVIVASANTILLISWVLVGPGHPLAGAMILLHLAFYGVPVFLSRWSGPDHPVVTALREGYALALIPLVWVELALRRVDLSQTYDRLVAQWDTALFGIHWHEVLGTVLNAPAVAEAMNGFYFSYYIMIVAVPVLVIARRREALRDLTTRLAGTYLLCFSIYAVLPVAGPMTVAGDPSASSAGGFFFGLTWALREVGDAVGTAFPSSHTAGGLALAWLAVRWCPRPVAVAAVVCAAGIAASTVYTRHHYLIDMAAGIAVCLAVQLLIIPALERLTAARRAALSRGVSDAPLFGM